MAEELAIRDVRVEDAEALAPLITELGRPAAPEQMRARLERVAAHPDYHALVAERGGRVIGMAGMMRGLTFNDDHPSVRLLSVVVDPAERGGGVGAALLAAAEEWARAQGARQVHLTSGMHRQDAHRFYRREGYEARSLKFDKNLG